MEGVQTPLHAVLACDNPLGGVEIVEHTEEVVVCAVHVNDAVRMVEREETVQLCEVLVGLCEVRMVEHEERVVKREERVVERVA